MMDMETLSGKPMRQAPMDELMELLAYVTPGNHDIPPDLQEIANTVYERINIELVARSLKL